MIPNFRGFNKKTKKMYSVEGFKAIERKIYRCSLADDEFRQGHMETIHFVEDNLDDYILMQSTGLFDKNGKEIFENDIVLTTIFVGRADENGCFYEYEKEYKGVVRMLEGAWIIDTGKDVADLWTEVDENEVIGNIHQNSDLLESVEE